MRYAALLALLPLVACSSTSSQEERQLAAYQHNAKLYFENGKLDQAMQMVDRGLEIEGDNYQLRSLRAALLLEMSVQRDKTDHKLLQQALAQFESVEGERSMNRHEPYFVFYSALALQRDGMRHVGEAARLRSPAAMAVDASASAEPAAAEDNAATASLDEARSRLEVLLDRGEMVRFCHFHLMQIAATQRRAEDVIRHGDAYLQAAKEDLTRMEREIRLAREKGWENELLANRERLRSEEIATRSFLADFHNDRAESRKDRAEFQKAREHLDEILRLDPTRSADYYNRGRVLRELQQIEASKADFRRFLATSPLPADSPKKIDAVQALGQ